MQEWKNWIALGIASPLIVIMSIGIWASSVRTRDNEIHIAHMSDTVITYQGRVMRRFDDLEARVQTVEILNERIATIAAKQVSMDEIWHTVISENREEHQDIKARIKDLKSDLIREFRKNGGR